MAGVGDPRHGRDPDDLPIILLRAAVHRHAAWSGGSSRRPVAVVAARPDGVSMGVLTYKGADRAGGDRERGRRRRSRAGRRSRASGNNGKRSPARNLFAAVGLHQLPHLPRHGLARTSAPRTLDRRGREGQGASSSRSTTSSARAASTQARRCRRSPRLGEDNLHKLADLPRGVEGARRVAPLCVFLGITGASGAPYAAGCWRRSPAPAARSASAPRAPGSRCWRPSCYGDARLSGGRDAGAADRAGARRGHAVRRARLARAVRERLGQGGRLRDLPVLDGHARGRSPRARCRT